MALFVVVVTLDLEGQIALELTWRDLILSIVIADQLELQLQSGEEAIHHGVVPAAFFGGLPADDLLLSAQIAVIGGPVLTALICVEEQLLGLHLAVAEDSGCHQRTQVYEQARQRHPRRWSRSVRCWRQPAVVWINEPPDPTTAEEELLFVQVAVIGANRRLLS